MQAGHEMSDPTTVTVPSGPFHAEARVPGDKSLGHRALILAAIAEGHSVVRGLSRGSDIESTRQVIGALGVRVVDDAVESPGFDGWQRPTVPLQCGNSGTTMRLVTGAVAAAAFDTVLVGDESLSARPMLRLVAPLGALGAEIEVTPGGTAPITVRGAALRGADVTIPVASAQVRTAVALAALHARGRTVIDSPPGFRDHTEHWLAALGRAERIGETRLLIEPGPISPLDVEVPGDPSSAAFLWAAAAVRPGSRVVTRGISLNRGRLGFLRLLREMGAEVQVDVTGQVLGDPIGDAAVASASLQGITVDRAEVAASIDELPLLAVVAAAAEGTTVVSDASELSLKESDRITGAVALARVAGRQAHATDTGFVVGPARHEGEGALDSQGDHRIAMAAAVAAVVRGEPISIGGFDACAVSWPGFREALEELWS
jgi:3-phosphoshikimate 1-carboxyvinyltransferase